MIKSDNALSTTQSASRWTIAYSYLSFSLVMGQVTGFLLTAFSYWNCSRFHLIGSYAWDPDRFWMLALVDMSLAIALLVFCSPLGLVLPRKSFNFIFPGLTTFVLFSGLLFSFSKLSIWAALLLSLGAALQMARSFQNSPEFCLKACRRIAPIGCLLTLTTAAIIQGQQSTRNSYTASDLPEPPQNAPNILFIVWDTVRADFVGTFDDSGVATPHLDQLAEQGTVFHRAVAPASWTLPSHASMFTGQFPNELSTDWLTPIPEQQVMLAEVLSEHGYLTSGFVSNAGYCGRSAGMHQGFAHFEDFIFSWKKLFLANFYSRLFYFHVVLPKQPSLSIEKTGREVTRDFLTWKKETQFDHPEFTFLNYMDAHYPYLPENLDGRSLTHQEVLQMLSFRYAHPGMIDDQLQQLAIACYREQIKTLDRELGKILNFLKTEEELNNTVIIVASDHGEQFGEHGIYYHGNSLYQSVVHVPLVVCDFRDPKNRTVVQQPVSLRNLGATILDFARVPAGHQIQGTSLRSISMSDNSEGNQQNPVYGYNSMEQINNPRYPAPAFFKNSLGWKGRMDLWVDDTYSFIRGPDGQIELYNLITDPMEENDLSEKNETKSSILNSQLDQFLDK